MNIFCRALASLLRPLFAARWKQATLLRARKKSVCKKMTNTARLYSVNTLFWLFRLVQNAGNRRACLTRHPGEFVSVGVRFAKVQISYTLFFFKIVRSIIVYSLKKRSSLLNPSIYMFPLFLPPTSLWKISYRPLLLLLLFPHILSDTSSLPPYYKTFLSGKKSGETICLSAAERMRRRRRGNSSFVWKRALHAHSLHMRCQKSNRTLPENNHFPQKQKKFWNWRKIGRTGEVFFAIPHLLYISRSLHFCGKPLVALFSAKFENPLLWPPPRRGDCVLPNSLPIFVAKALYPSQWRIFSDTCLSAEKKEILRVAKEWLVA